MIRKQDPLTKAIRRANHVSVRAIARKVTMGMRALHDTPHYRGLFNDLTGPEYATYCRMVRAAYRLEKIMDWRLGQGLKPCFNPNTKREIRANLKRQMQEVNSAP